MDTSMHHNHEQHGGTGTAEQHGPHGDGHAEHATPAQVGAREPGAYRAPIGHALDPHSEVREDGALVHSGGSGPVVRWGS